MSAPSRRFAGDTSLEVSAHAAVPKPTPFEVRQPKSATPFARWKSRAIREVAAALPRSLLVTRGTSPPGRRCVALTFDDGPDEMSRAYLDVLDALAVRATFFLIGENAVQKPDAVLDYVKRGHEVAGHGYTHEPFPSMGAAVLVDELTRAADLLPPSISSRPLVRPPLGRMSASSIVRVAAAGFTTVLWSLDSDDCRTRDPRTVEARVSPQHVSPGEIILMHEMQPWTLDALPRVVHNLREAGFELATVSELLGC